MTRMYTPSPRRACWVSEPTENTRARLLALYSPAAASTSAVSAPSAAVTVAAVSWAILVRSVEAGAMPMVTLSSVVTVPPSPVTVCGSPRSVAVTRAALASAS